MIFNLICIIVIVLLGYHIFNKSKVIFICFLPFFIQYTWMAASIVVIEQGAYINEQDKYGDFYFTNFYILLFFIVSLISFLFFYKIFEKAFNIGLPRVRFLKNKEIKIALFLAVSIVLVSLISLFSGPSAYTSETVTKFNYWDKATYPWLKALLGSTIGYLPFIFGVLYSKYKKTTIILIVLYLIYLVGVDQKFTAFMYGFIGFILSHVIIRSKHVKIKDLLNFKKRYLAIVGSLIFSLVLLKYTNKNPYAYLNLTPVESVFYRAFGLQAHVFWGVNEKYVYNKAPNTWDLSELPYGMHVVMKDFTPSFRQKYLERLWEGGVSWTNAYPAILLRIFPVPIALAFHFLLFSIVPLIYAMLVKMIRKENYLIAIILFQLTMWLTNIYSMAFFYRLTKVVVIFLFIAFLSKVYSYAKE
ncbi:DUF6418 domain-containing protein [Winogradskyella sp.]|uniref:DUF6418 domain-containing protein n=1 Tax=Winogradskyella sp. TaxID=1883156 RepID=UPI002620AC2E|nr:DUF6418 domain-containing protein [uncultured Winogradskyella sp.]